MHEYDIGKEGFRNPKTFMLHSQLIACKGRRKGPMDAAGEEKGLVSKKLKD